MLVIYERTLIEHLAFIHSKLALIMWGVLYFVYSPTIIVNELGIGLVNASAGFSIFGGLLGIFGLHMSNAKDVKRKYQGVIVESSGLTIALCGPLAFFVTSAYLTIHLSEPQLHSITAISYALCASIISRIVVVRRGFKKGV